MPNGNDRQNSYTNFFNNPVDSVICTISWGTKVCGLERNNRIGVSSGCNAPPPSGRALLHAGIGVSGLGTLVIEHSLWSRERS